MVEKTMSEQRKTEITRQTYIELQDSELFSCFKYSSKDKLEEIVESLARSESK